MGFAFCYREEQAKDICYMGKGRILWSDRMEPLIAKLNLVNKYEDEELSKAKNKETA